MATYNDIIKVWRSDILLQRVIAAAASEGKSDPDGVVRAHWWAIASQPGWADAWASIESGWAGDDTRYIDFGDRTDVITDGMILAAVQGTLP